MIRGHPPTRSSGSTVRSGSRRGSRRRSGTGSRTVMALLRTRAPVFLRVNAARATVEDAVSALAGEGIVAVPHPLSATALEVTENARRVKSSAAFREGLVELQDAASQAVVDLLLPWRRGRGCSTIAREAGGRRWRLPPPARG